MQEALKFHLALKEIPVELVETDGRTTSAVIREITGKQRDDYVADLAKRMKYVDGKPAGIRSVEGLAAYLLSLCLVDKTDDTLMSLDRIQTFPSQVQDALYKEAETLSGLGLSAEAEAVAKKDLGGNDSDGSKSLPI